jgi:hypothetical protein
VRYDSVICEGSLPVLGHNTEWRNLNQQGGAPTSRSFEIWVAAPSIWFLLRNDCVYELIRFLFLPRSYLVTPSLPAGNWYRVSTPAVELLMAVHRHANEPLPAPTPPIPDPTLARFSLDTKQCLRDWRCPSSEQSKLCQLAHGSSGVLSLLVESTPYLRGCATGIGSAVFADLAYRRSSNPTKFTLSCSR